MGLVRGVTPSALLVHSNIEIIAGDWPQPNEVMIGRLAATKIGATEQETRIGQSLWLEGREWRISGVFSAAGAVFESEVWCRLDGLQQAMKRQDLSLVALMLEPDAEFQDVDLFCKERLDLELQAVSQIEYFQTLRKDYAPVRMLAWLVAFLIFAAGVFAGLKHHVRSSRRPGSRTRHLADARFSTSSGNHQHRPGRYDACRNGFADCFRSRIAHR